VSRNVIALVLVDSSCITANNSYASSLCFDDGSDCDKEPLNSVLYYERLLDKYMIQVF